MKSSQKWLVCLTKQQLVALRKRNKQCQFIRLSVSCRVQWEILLHLVFCRLRFDYFVCRTTMEDLGETKKLKSVKQHCVRLLKGFHPDLPSRTELILVSNFRSCSSDLSLISSLLTCSKDWVRKCTCIDLVIGNIIRTQNVDRPSYWLITDKGL